MAPRSTHVLDNYKARVARQRSNAVADAAEAALEAKEERSRRVVPEYRQVYFIEAQGRGLVKIGSADDAMRRLATLQTGSPDKLILRGVFYVDDAEQFERSHHQSFADQWVRGEWFRMDDKIRACMANLTEYGNEMIKLALHQPSGPPPVASVYWQPGDTNETFSLRVCKVLEALGDKVEYDDPSLN